MGGEAVREQSSVCVLLSTQKKKFFAFLLKSRLSEKKNKLEWKKEKPKNERNMVVAVVNGSI